MVRPCQLQELARSTAYAQPRPVSASDLALMRRIDELQLASPFAGARMLRDLLRREGLRIGRKRARKAPPAGTVPPSSIAPTLQQSIMVTEPGARTILSSARFVTVSGQRPDVAPARTIGAKCNTTFASLSDEL